MRDGGQEFVKSSSVRPEAELVVTVPPNEKARQLLNSAGLRLRSRPKHVFGGRKVLASVRRLGICEVGEPRWNICTATAFPQILENSI